MKTGLSLLLALVCVVPVFAQPDSLWSRTYGGAGYDFATNTEPTADGGYLLVGETDSYGAGSYDIWLLRIDGAGDSLWNRTYGGVGADHFLSCQAVNGGYVLAGSLDGAAWLLRLDENGDSLWSRTYSGMPATAAQSIRATDDGGLVLAGSVVSGESQTNLQLLRLTADGTPQWTRTYGGPADETATALAQTADGGFIVAGTTRSYGAGSWNAWLLKTTAGGDSVWSRAFGGDSLDIAVDMVETADSGIVVAGTTRSSGPGHENVWLFKTSAAGDSLWSRTCGTLGGWQGATDLLATADGGFVLSGYNSSEALGVQYWLLRTNAEGDSLWSRDFGGSDWDEAYHVVPATDGGYMLVGGTQSFGAGNVDVWLIKLSAEQLAAGARPSRLPATFALGAYPNPFNPTTTIHYLVPRAGHVSVSVVNTLGERVATLVDAAQNAGEQRVVWDAGALATGVYFVHATVAGQTRVTRLLLVK